MVIAGGDLGHAGEDVHVRSPDVKRQGLPNSDGEGGAREGVGGTSKSGGSAANTTLGTVARTRARSPRTRPIGLLVSRKRRSLVINVLLMSAEKPVSKVTPDLRGVTHGAR